MALDRQGNGNARWAIMRSSLLCKPAVTFMVDLMLALNPIVLDCGRATSGVPLLFDPCNTFSYFVHFVFVLPLIRQSFSLNIKVDFNGDSWCLSLGIQSSFWLLVRNTLVNVASQTTGDPLHNCIAVPSRIYRTLRPKLMTLEAIILR